MGMHEANNIALTHLALQCYEAFRPVFPQIVMVFQQVPGINQEDLIKFDNKFLCTNAAFGEKAKKDMFKKLISQLVGKDMARLFKKEIIIKNLPNLVPLKVKAKTPSLDEQTERTGEDTGLLQLFN
jgi:exportin-5